MTVTFLSMGHWKWHTKILDIDSDIPITVFELTMHVRIPETHSMGVLFELSEVLSYL